MGNKLKEVFSNQEISYKGKISFKNKEAYEDFIEALNSVQEEGRTIRVNGVTDIETSVQTGNNIYPISEQEEIVDVIIGPSKEKVTFNIDTELGKRDINFSRFHTNDNIVLETKQDEIVYLKIVLEKGTGKSKITYRAQPEKDKSINEIIEHYNMMVAFFDRLFKQPIEAIKKDTQIKEWNSIKSMKKYFEEAILQYKKLHFVEQEVEITIDPSKLQQDEEECWRDTEELYIILKKKMPIRINTKLTEIKTNDLKINQQKENIKVGTALDVTFIKRKEFYLWGETVEIYTSNLLTNAIVKEIIELENGTTKISYGEEDSRPMFISYKGFKTEKEAENEMKSIMENKEAYVNAKRLGEYLAEE